MSNKTVYEKVADVLIARMEQGVIPWRMPWAAGGVAKNLVSGKAYRGINAVLLPSAGYASPYFVTFNQARQLGGHVRKGEKALPVVFWKWLDKKSKDGEPVVEGEEPGRIPMMRLYYVFNVAQCEGLKHKRLTEVVEAREFSPIESAARAIKSYLAAGPSLSHGGGQACYTPSSDAVRMPEPGTFVSAEAYYSTLFHELVHSTGHEKRLAREGVVNPIRFKSHTYAAEELVAEFGASFLRAVSGIEKAPEVENSAAYLQSWLKVVKSDPRALVIAAGQAQRAADLIQGVQYEDV